MNEVAKYWIFSFSTIPSKEIPGYILKLLSLHFPFLLCLLFFSLTSLILIECFIWSCFLSFLNFPMTLLFIVSPTHPTAGTPFFLHLSTDPMSLTAPGGPLPWSETRLAEPLPGRSVLPLGEALVKGAQQGAARDCGCQPPPCGWAGRSGLLRARSCQALTCQSHLEASPGLPFCCTENTQDSESSLSRSEF